MNLKVNNLNRHKYMSLIVSCENKIFYSTFLTYFVLHFVNCTIDFEYILY